MKILFLEDRPSRQQLFLPNKADDVNIIKSLDDVFMPESNECKMILKEINKREYGFSASLKLIIVHKSALETSGLDYIDNYCKKNSVRFICFSGAISQIIYTNENYEFLNINSSDFYGDRLIPFLKSFISDNSQTVLELVNRDWKLSYLFLARQILYNMNIEEDEDSKFLFEEKLEGLSKILNLDIEITDLKKLNKIINRKILEL